MDHFDISDLTLQRPVITPITSLILILFVFVAIHGVMILSIRL